MYIRRLNNVQSLLVRLQRKQDQQFWFPSLCRKLSSSSENVKTESLVMPYLEQEWCGQKVEQNESAVQTGNVNINWHPGSSERAFASGKKIILDWKRRLRMSSYRGTAVFVLGAMGSGKSTIIETEFKQHPEFRHYAYVDTDGFMEMLEGFSPEKVEQYYPIAREVAIYLTDWLLTENISFVAEGTCVKFLELEDYMERLRDTGYCIKVRRIDSPPLDTVLVRARRRQNRKLSDDLVRSIFYGSRHGIEQLFKLNVDQKLFMEI